MALGVFVISNCEHLTHLAKPLDEGEAALRGWKGCGPSTSPPPPTCHILFERMDVVVVLEIKIFFIPAT